ncbi:hypothetical protein MMC12_000681 [Toensbergia leucococca]|nr:hypothetical protein [Toensbergia leucococca]
MLQRSPADNFPSEETLSPARTSVFICLADIIIATIWLARGLRAGQGFRESARVYRSEMGIYSDFNILMKGTPAVGLIVFVLVPVPQALKLFGSRGIPGTQACMVIFLLAYLVSIFISTIGVPHNDKSTRSKPREKFDEKTRQALVTFSDIIYVAAYLAQFGIWILIVVELFRSDFVSSIESSESAGMARFTYTCIILLWVIASLALLQKVAAAGVLVLLSGIIYLVKMPQSRYVAWATGPWINGFAPFLSVVICGLVAIAFISAGVFVTIFINGCFEQLGKIIEGPPAVKHVKASSNHEHSTSSGGCPALEASPRANSEFVHAAEHLQGSRSSTPAEPNSHSRQTNELSPRSPASPQRLLTLEVPEATHLAPDSPIDSPTSLDSPIGPRVRRAKSLHFPLTDLDHALSIRRLSLTLEANLPDDNPAGIPGVDSAAPPEIHHSPSTKAVYTRKFAAKEESSTHRLFWDSTDHRFYRRALSIGFAITNLILTTLFYGYKYSKEGTYRAPWTEQVA